MQVVEVYCSVITGFEFITCDEVQARLGVRCERGRGFVRFTIGTDVVHEVSKLRSPDNVFGIVLDNCIDRLGVTEKEDALDRIKNLTSLINWELAIESWQQAQGKEMDNGITRLKEQMRDFMKNGTVSQANHNFPTFRVTCNRAGDKSQHNFSSMDAARSLGAQINNTFGWRPDMNNYDIKIILKIKGDRVTVMVALNKESLFKRNVCAYGPTTMRSTMCFCMVSLAKPQIGEIIIDAMCGGGSIPLEGTLSVSGCFFLGGDTHPKAIKRCHENKKNCDISLSLCDSSLDFLFWDATRLPFRDSSIDAIVTDLPFGKKMGSTVDNRILYPRLLREWHRVVKPSGRIVVLTHDKRSWESAKMLWALQPIYENNQLILTVGKFFCTFNVHMGGDKVVRSDVILAENIKFSKIFSIYELFGIQESLGNYWNYINNGFNNLFLNICVYIKYSLYVHSKKSC